MWGRLPACGRLSTGHSRCSADFEKPIDNRPQAASLPHIGSAEFLDIRSSEDSAQGIGQDAPGGRRHREAEQTSYGGGDVEIANEAKLRAGLDAGAPGNEDGVHIRIRAQISVRA